MKLVLLRLDYLILKGLIVVGLLRTASWSPSHVSASPVLCFVVVIIVLFLSFVE